MERGGHRGAMGYEPENTPSSFIEALRIGVDFVEFDVYALKDGKIVVFHDDTLERTTDGKGNILEKTYEELQQLDAGKGQKIPTLQEVLHLINRQTTANIELKGPGTAAPIAAVIQQYVEENGWEYDDFLVSSFDHEQLKEFKELIPQVQIGALIEDTLPENAAFAQKMGAAFVGPGLDIVTEPFVKDAHERGLKCFVFTVNNPDDIQRMERMGVDGVFSNYPDRVKRKNE